MNEKLKSSNVKSKILGGVYQNLHFLVNNSNKL